MHFKIGQRTFQTPYSTSVTDSALGRLVKEVSKGNVIIMGDLNYANINWKEHSAKGSGKKFLKIVDNCFLEQLVGEPTRCDKILDIILTSDRNLVDGVSVMEGLGDSDHDAVTCTIKFTGKIVKESKVFEFNYYKADYESMSRELERVMWTDLIQENVNIDECYSEIKSVISKLADKYIPLKRSKKWKKGNWVNRSC